MRTGSKSSKKLSSPPATLKTQKTVKPAAAKKMTVTQKYNSMKRQAEEAGMRVYEKDGKLRVVRVNKKK